MKLRIISGSLRGKKIQSVPGTDIRPTSNRVREAIFNILSNSVSGVHVLDLFAGSGPLGIEAMSRGAESTVFIDNNKNAVSVIEKNIDSCSLTKRVEIISCDVVYSLSFLKSARPEFKLVFMDPPYNKNLIKPALVNIHLSGSLKKNARIIIEHSSSEKIPQDLQEFNIEDEKKYGKTKVSFLIYRQKSELDKQNF